LDLKPANVLITFEGVLKISDFGMATQWPAPPGIDGEGDREYIGPEILMGRFDKPSDIFALGLIMLEIAGNVMLPDNGTSWQRLRSGDMSDVPSLTWSSATSTIFRDSSGKPLSPDASAEDPYGSDSGEDEFGSVNFLRRRREEQGTIGAAKHQILRPGELAQPPDFMIDASHPEALDNVVRWMISPESNDRPVVDQILRTTGVRWAEARRRAGATIYEGNWGPADEILADDAEMIDV
jgi:mitosis inhibitor protein kinase SWE1